MSQGLQREWLKYNVYVINIIEYMIECDFFRISGERISLPLGGAVDLAVDVVFWIHKHLIV